MKFPTLHLGQSTVERCLPELRPGLIAIVKSEDIFCEIDFWKCLFLNMNFRNSWRLLFQSGIGRHIFVQALLENTLVVHVRVSGNGFYQLRELYNTIFWCTITKLGPASAHWTTPPFSSKKTQFWITIFLRLSTSEISRLSFQSSYV